MIDFFFLLYLGRLSPNVEYQAVPFSLSVLYLTDDEDFWLFNYWRRLIFYYLRMCCCFLVFVLTVEGVGILMLKFCVVGFSMII